MSSELLPTPEQPHRDHEQRPDNTSLTRMTFEHILKERIFQLQSIENLISKKLLFTLEERLSEERQTVEELLGLSKTDQSQKKRYTNILDTQYFEQKLLN